MTELTANYDDTWKKAITEYFESFLLFFYQDIHNVINWHKTPISLDKELEQITAASETEKRHADKLYQVWLLNNQPVWLLIHIEVQSQYDKDFAQRMFIYWTLDKRRPISVFTTIIKKKKQGNLSSART